jgi:hypothetical protein
MKNQELEKNVAFLESVNDQLMAEIAYIDQLMRTIGFSDGLRTVKESAEELFREERE